MVVSRGRHLFILAAAALLVSCGDQPLFMSLGGSSATSDITVTSVTDGQIVARDSTIPLTIGAQDTSKAKDVAVEVTITSATGDVVLHEPSAPASLNDQTTITLPAGLPSGLYKLEVVVTTNGDVTQRKTTPFFVATDGYRVVGISSFPPLITITASVMLKADLQVPPKEDPWLRWSWKGKAISKGLLSQGYDQILWVAPSDEGVYTITLEMFPTAPADGDYPFASSVRLSTDVFVTNGKTQGKGDLTPESSYLTLLHLEANLNDSGTGAKTNGITAAIPVGNPRIVSLEDGFGYALDGTTGIRIPWFPLPSLNGALKPFTISIAITPDDPSHAGPLIAAQTDDHAVSLSIAMDPQGQGPHAILTVTGQTPFDIPWTGEALQPMKRSLVSLSLTPQGTSLTAQWFLDGIQQSSASASLAVTGVKQKGSLTLGGEKGFVGVVDEFGVFALDASGRSSTDPDLFARSQADLYGTQLVFADGFDATNLSSTFTAEGSAPINAGTISLAPGSSLGLPPVKLDGTSITVSATLTSDSPRAAVLQAQWEGSSASAGQAALTADSTGLHFRIGADGQSLITGSGASQKTIALIAPTETGARLLLTLANPADARSPLALTQVLAIKDSQER